MMLTINELAKKTGLSSYEIRRRVHNGSCPHTRVGAKQTKILINEELFNHLLSEESVQNMTVYNHIISDNGFSDNMGYDRVKKIN